MVSKSLSKAGGKSIYRGLLDIGVNAARAVAKVECDGLVLDAESLSDAFPDIRTRRSDATVAYEATAGALSEEALFYLQSRGLSLEQAEAMVVNGFLSPVLRELPLEYAAEMNVLIAMEFEG